MLPWTILRKPFLLVCLSHFLGNIRHSISILRLRKTCAQETARKKHDETLKERTTKKESLEQDPSSRTQHTSNGFIEVALSQFRKKKKIAASGEGAGHVPRQKMPSCAAGVSCAHVRVGTGKI